MISCLKSNVETAGAVAEKVPATGSASFWKIFVKYCCEAELIVASELIGCPAGRICVHVRVVPEIVPLKHIGKVKTPFRIPADGTRPERVE